MIIAFFNQKGGVGSTTLAFHTCLRAQSRGVRVAAISIDPTQELRRRLAETPVPVIELADDGDTGETADLYVVDVNAQTAAALPICPDVWVLPITNRRSWEQACALSDVLTGEIVWLPNLRSHDLEGCGEHDLRAPAYLADTIRQTTAIPRSHAIAIVNDQGGSLWEDVSLAASPGGRALTRAIDDILESIDLLPCERRAS